MIKFFKTHSLEKTLELFFLNLFLLPIYPDNVKPTVLILFFITAIIYSFKNKDGRLKVTPALRLLLYTNTALFFVLSISLFYSSNLTYGINYLFRILPLLIIPFAFFLIRSHTSIFNFRIFTKAKLLFYVSTLFLFIVIFILFYFRGFVTENYFLNYSYRIIFQLSKYSMHPIYASLITSIALIFSISLFKIQRYKVLIIIGNLLLIINLLLLSRKSAIIIMTLLFVVFLVFNKKILFKIKALSMFLICLTFFMMLKFTPDISNRFNDFYTLFDTTNASSSNLRINLFKLSVDAIKEKPIFGYGIGDVQDVLNALEEQKSFFKNKFYNSHNQYLTVTIATGFVGLLVFLFFLYSNLKAALLGGFEQLAIVLFFILLMFIENILDRQNGVLYFALFINYFSYYNYINKKV